MQSNRPKQLFSNRAALWILVILGIVALGCIPQCRFAAVLAKADIEHSLGYKKWSIADYRTAVEIEPSSEEALGRLIALLQDDNQGDNALTFLHMLEHMDTPSAQLTVAEHMSEITLSKRDYNAALNFSNQWIALAPNNARAYHAKGDALAGLGRSDEAVEALDRSLQIDPGSGAAPDRDALLQKSRVFETYTESVSHPKLENNFSDYDALLRDCVRLNMADQDQNAEEAATKAMRLKPDGASAVFLRGWSRMIEHNYDGALADIRAAERLANHKSISFPILNTGQVLPSHYEFADLVFFEGCIEQCRKDYKSALTNFDRAIALRQFGDYFTARAKLYRILGRVNDAERDEAVAAKITPKRSFKNVPIKEPLETILAP